MTITPTIESGIRRATVGDTSGVARTVAAGFFDDPVTQWILPQVERRQQVATAMFKVYVEPYVAAGETYLTRDASGASAWLAPGVELMTAQQEEAFGAALVELLGPDADRCFQLAEIFAQHHPEEPLYYCQFLSTVPAFQGRGIGTALLRDMLERADREGVPSYLEATSPRNRVFYERHGYVTTGVFTLPNDGPPLWPMWRQPGG
jgi:GNAT superfamily N-acetyltransferase